MFAAYAEPLILHEVNDFVRFEKMRIVGVAG